VARLSRMGICIPNSRRLTGMVGSYRIINHYLMDIPVGCKEKQGDSDKKDSH